MRILLAALLVALPAAALASAQHYNIVDLGSPYGDTSFGRGINNLGTVVGYYYGEYGEDQGFVAVAGQASTTIDVTPLGGVAADAAGINDRGQIVGSYGTADFHGYAYRYTPGVGIEQVPLLPDQDDGAGNAINQAGVIAGTNTQNRGPRDTVSDKLGFFQAPGEAPVDIGSLDYPFNFGYAINNVGQVAGQGLVVIPPDPNDPGDEGTSYSRAIVYTPGIGLTQYNPLGRSSHATAINDAGQIALYAFNFDLDFRHAFVFTPGVGYVELNPDGDNYTPNGINSFGVTVGGVETYDAYYGFIYDGRGVYDLNRLIDNLADGDTVFQAYAINDRGQITGDALINGQLHAFRLDPTGLGAVPEPATWALMLAGFGIAGTRLRRSGKSPTLDVG